MVKIRYFAWLREQIGHSEEMVEFPASIVTVAELIDWLKQRSPDHAAALERTSAVRAALDQHHVMLDTPIAGAREIALFPPVTGG